MFWKRGSISPGVCRKLQAHRGLCADAARPAGGFAPCIHRSGTRGHSAIFHLIPFKFPRNSTNCTKFHMLSRIAKPPVFFQPNLACAPNPTFPPTLMAVPSPSCSSCPTHLVLLKNARFPAISRELPPSRNPLRAARHEAADRSGPTLFLLVLGGVASALFPAWLIK